MSGLHKCTCKKRSSLHAVFMRHPAQAEGAPAEGAAIALCDTGSYRAIGTPPCAGYVRSPVTQALLRVSCAVASCEVAACLPHRF